MLSVVTGVSKVLWQLITRLHWIIYRNKCIRSNINEVKGSVFLQCIKGKRNRHFTLCRIKINRYLIERLTYEIEEVSMKGISLRFPSLTFHIKTLHDLKNSAFPKGKCGVTFQIAMYHSKYLLNEKRVIVGLFLFIILQLSLRLLWDVWFHSVGHFFQLIDSD